MFNFKKITIRSPSVEYTTRKGVQSNVLRDKWSKKRAKIDIKQDATVTLLHRHVQ